MAVTSVDLDKGLVERVKAITGARSQREAITLAPQSVERRARQRRSIVQLLALPVENDPRTIDYPVD